MQFFVFHPVIGSDAETTYEPVGQVVLGESPRCPACEMFAGMKPWLPSYRVSLRRHGSLIGDIAFDSGNDLLLSEAFVTAWRSNGLTGLEHIEPVEVVSVLPKSLEGKLQRYYHVGLERTNTRIDRSRSVILGREPDCELCGGPGPIEAVLALRIDETSWTGEDIFIPWGTADIVVTENVVNVASKHGLANVTTTPIEEFRWDPLRKH